MDINCSLESCQKPFDVRPSRIAKSKSGLLFCSKPCKDKAVALGVSGDANYLSILPKHYPMHLLVCKNCNKKITGKRRECCSVACSHEYKKNIRIQKWLEDPTTANTAAGTATWVRNYLIEKAGNKCTLCGWGEVNPTTGKIPLELDHIDGNHLNSDINNLRIICPNCHSLTPNYKALNKNKVEASRYKYFREKGWW